MRVSEADKPNTILAGLGIAAKNRLGLDVANRGLASLSESAASQSRSEANIEVPGVLRTIDVPRAIEFVSRLKTDAVPNWTGIICRDELGAELGASALKSYVSQPGFQHYRLGVKGSGMPKLLE